ncbi:hypothetical protein FACS1894190_07510 [Spirochaetia bacterium]|nr:hypothetical protein FACS1894190_07510 [Spirochaetia bacterium]
MEENRVADETKIEKKDLVFYYSREERLAKASQRVRDFNAPIKKPRFGLFTSLVDTKPKAMTFISIVAMSLILYLVTTFYQNNDQILLGNKITADAVRYEGSSFIVIKKDITDKKNFFTGIVDLSISIAAGAGNAESASKNFKMSNYKIVFTDNKTEDYRFNVPLEAPELFIFMQAADKTVTLRIEAK